MKEEKGKDKVVEYTIASGPAHLYMLGMIIPVLLVYAGSFIFVWNYDELRSGIVFFVEYFIPVIIAGVIIHEILHGIGWSLYLHNGFKSIKFGFNWKFLSPYCHCREPLKVWQYIVGAALPLIILGILPAFIGILLGNSSILFFGVIFTWVAGGDIISLLMLSKLDKDIYIYDHPDKLGFYTRVRPEI